MAALLPTGARGAGRPRAKDSVPRRAAHAAACPLVCCEAKGKSCGFRRFSEANAKVANGVMAKCEKESLGHLQRETPRKEATTPDEETIHCAIRAGTTRTALEVVPTDRTRAVTFKKSLHRCSDPPMF